MNKILLLPYPFKKIGWALFIPTSLFGLMMALDGFNGFPSYLLPGEMIAGSAADAACNTIAIIGVLVGALFITCSRERIEDELIARIRLNALLAALYVNLAAVKGPEDFFARAAAAGADAVLLPDVPISMRVAEPLWDKAAEKAGIDMAAIAPPNAEDDVLEEAARRSGSYTYLLSRAGTTGADRAAGHSSPHSIGVLKKAGAAPLLLGFGVSAPQHVEEARAMGADGVIVGSAIGSIIEHHLDDKAKLLEELERYARAMKAATKR